MTLDVSPQVMEAMHQFAQCLIQCTFVITGGLVFIGLMNVLGHWISKPKKPKPY